MPKKSEGDKDIVTVSVIIYGVGVWIGKWIYWTLTAHTF
jgi:hypothetical protein